MSIVYNDPAYAAANSAYLAGGFANADECIELDSGVTFIAGEIPLTTSGNKFRGKGQFSSFLFSTSPTNAMISIADGAVSPEVSGLTLMRASGVTAVGNAPGINFLGSSSFPVIKDNYIQGQGIGIIIRGCGYGHIKGNYIGRCNSSGIYMSPSPNAGSLSFILEDNLVELCGSHGFLVDANVSVPGVPQIIMGDWINNRTFANTGYGMYFRGAPAQPIQGIRIAGGFLGNDASGEITVEAYGQNHVIRGVYGELAGTGPTGPTYTTPASHSGNGIVLSPNEGTVVISDCLMASMSNHGILTRAALTQIDGCTLLNNGFGGSVGAGAYIDNGANAMVTGTATKGNASGPLIIASNPGSLVSAGNRLV